MLIRAMLFIAVLYHCYFLRSYIDVNHYNVIHCYLLLPYINVNVCNVITLLFIAVLLYVKVFVLLVTLLYMNVTCCSFQGTTVVYAMDRSV